MVFMPCLHHLIRGSPWIEDIHVYAVIVEFLENVNGARVADVRTVFFKRDAYHPELKSLLFWV